jgi:hypothetical protein
MRQCSSASAFRCEFQDLSFALRKLLINFELETNGRYGAVSSRETMVEDVRVGKVSHAATPRESSE